MKGLELVCAVIVATWIAMRLRREPDSAGRRALLVRLGLVAAAAWIGEDTCIRAYGFYNYAPGWSAFIDQVPLAIVCIWPVVVLSSIDLAGHLTTSVRLRPIVVMALVIADASLIEPIAVKSGLWAWTEPGPFAVPIIGVLGWGFFAVGAAAVIARPARALVAGPVAAHALLLTTWWAALRWLPRGVDPAPFVVVAWLTSLTLTAWVVRARVHVAFPDLVLRVPAASFFFVLLALHAHEEPLLIAYAIAFAPPYLALTALAWRRRGAVPVSASPSA